MGEARGLEVRLLKYECRDEEQEVVMFRRIDDDFWSK